MTTINPHAPERDSSSARLLGRFHFSGVFWYRLGYWAAVHLPVWTENLTVWFFSTFFFLTLGRARRAIAANLEPLLGPANLFGRWLRALRTLRAFAWSMAERYQFYRRPHLFRTTVEGEENWRDAMAAGSGVILVSAHIGSWEIAPQFGAAAEKRRIHIIREREMDPQSQQFVRELIERTGHDVMTHFAGDEPALALELAEALQRGEIVALQGDRPRAGGRTVTATMFGRPMPLPVGPAALARVTNAPMVPVFNFRSGRFGSHVVVRPAIHVARSADREADVAAAMSAIAREIEGAIRREPHQWFCFRQLW